MRHVLAEDGDAELDGLELESLLRPEVAVEAGLAHAQVVCEAADRQGFQAVRRGQLRCMLEDPPLRRAHDHSISLDVRTIVC